MQPDHAPAYTNLGIIFPDQDASDEAAQCFSRSIRINFNYADALSNLGIALRGQGDLEQAIASYQQALTLNPSNPSILNNPGVAQREREASEEAKASFCANRVAGPCHRAEKAAFHPDLPLAEAEFIRAKKLLARKVPMTRADLARIFVTLVFVLLAGAHIFWPEKLDETALVLFALGTLPWVIPFLRANFTSVEAIGVKLDFVEKQVREQSKQLDDHSEALQRQRQVLDDITLYTMAYYIYDKLKFISLGTSRDYQDKFSEYKYVNNDAFNHDLRYLRDHGYLEMFQFSDLQPGENLVGKLRATEMGQRLVQLKESGLASVNE